MFAIAINRRTHTASFSAQLPDSATRPVLMAIRPSAGSHSLMAEARAFKGVVSAENEDDLEAFVSATARGSVDGFVLLETPPRVAPEGASTKAGEDMASEELYDPLLSRKRYESETAL